MAGIKFGKTKTVAPKAVAGKGRAATDDGQEGASLLPEEWVSGGLLNDVDVDILDLTFVDDWTYEGRIETPVLALRATMKDEEGTETIQHFSAGDLTRFVPSGDGKRAVKAEGSTATALNNNTNCAAFLGSIMEAGFPKKMVSDRVDVFEGMNVHVNRVPQQKRSGLANTDDRQRDVLIVTKINSLPGETVKPKAGVGKAAVAGKVAKPAGKAAVAAAPTNGAGQELDEETAVAAAEAIVAVLTDKGGEVPFKTLSLSILKHLAGNALRAEIIAICKDPEQLAAVGEATGVFTTDGETVTAA